MNPKLNATEIMPGRFEAYDKANYRKLIRKNMKLGLEEANVR